MEAKYIGQNESPGLQFLALSHLFIKLVQLQRTSFVTQTAAAAPEKKWETRICQKKNNPIHTTTTVNTFLLFSSLDWTCLLTRVKWKKNYLYFILLITHTWKASVKTPHTVGTTSIWLMNRAAWKMRRCTYIQCVSLNSPQFCFITLKQIKSVQLYV